MSRENDLHCVEAFVDCVKHCTSNSKSSIIVNWFDCVRQASKRVSDFVFGCTAVQRSNILLNFYCTEINGVCTDVYRKLRIINHWKDWLIYEMMSCGYCGWKGAVLQSLPSNLATYIWKYIPSVVGSICHCTAVLHSHDHSITGSLSFADFKKKDEIVTP